MFKHSFLIICMVALLITTNTFSADTVTGPYFGQTPPGATPQKFVFPAIDSQPDFLDSRVAFSPDGNECFFSGYNDWNSSNSQMYHTKCVNNVWTDPVVAPLMQPPGYNCSHPFFSADGNTLYFSKNADIWVVERTSQGWGHPQVLPAPINTSSYEGTYSQTNDGTAYIESYRSGGQGNNDVWRIRPRQPGQSPQVENIGPPVNSSALEGNAFVSSDGRYLLFGYNRSGGYNDELFVTFSNGDGGWTAPVNLNQYCHGINTDQQEYAPKISPDGHYLFFTYFNYDTQQGGVYWVENPIPQPDPNGPVCNLSTGERFGTIQAAIIYTQAGDNLELQPGIYRESIALDKDITIWSVDPNDPLYIGDTIIQGDPNEPVVDISGNSPACEIAGLTIRAGSIGIKGTGTNATIRNCRIMDNTTHGIELSQGSSPNLQNCMIASNGQTGITMLTGPGRSNCEPNIENCIIVYNGQQAIDGGEPVIVDSIIN